MKEVILEDRFFKQTQGLLLSALTLSGPLTLTEKSWKNAREVYLLVDPFHVCLFVCLLVFFFWCFFFSSF